VCFAPTAGFSKKKVESNNQLVRGAVRTLTGSAVDIRYELSELPADEDPTAALSEEELLERLKEEFGAKEIFDES
jgi:DNA-directed RNA polymerase specialized sigma54-like protein